MDYAIALKTLQSSDPILGQVIDRVGACTLDQAQHSGNLFYSLSRSIVYQQLSTASATAIYTRFLQIYANQILSPEALLATPDETLRGVGLSRQKISYLKDLAQKIVDVPEIPELELLDDETIIQTLMHIKGIGRWTVQMLLIFRLHRWDILPVDDLGIRSGIRRVYELADLPDKKTTEALGQAWKPYRTIASWYLWRVQDM